MAAYAALISLNNTIQRILQASLISLVPPSPKIIKSVSNELNSLKTVLERLDSSSKSKSRKKVNALDDHIKDALWRFEDALEFHIRDQIIPPSESTQSHLKSASIRRNIQRRRTKKRGKRFPAAWFKAFCKEEEEEEESDASQSENRGDALFSIDLEGLRHDAVTFVETVKKMKAEYIYELENLPEEEEDEESVALRNDFGGTKSKMVGLSDEFEEVKRYLTRTTKHVSLVGMAGIGKTTLAREVFEDPQISSHFKYRVWIKVGRKSQFNEISRVILAQVDPSISETTQGDDRIDENLEERVKGEKCLIVLDDVWDENVLDDCTRSLPSMFRVLLTSRERIIAAYLNRSMSGWIEVMRFLNEDESKHLLCEKVFGEEDFPPQLKKAGKKIVHSCEGLPLMLVAVANYLSKGEKTPEYWNEVAEKRNSVFTDAYNDISKVLFPTYDYLPQYLKMLFLYMGAFPQDYEIPISKLINILTAEGFLELHTKEGFIDRCLNELDFWKNLFITNPKSKSWFMKIFYPIKTCRLHSSWQHLCRVEARKNKFFHILNSRDGVEGMRRLCVHSNNTLCINEAYNSLKCASTARSLLCFGPYHQYPVPIDVGFEFLRVLDALKVRFYHFPVVILKLVHLQYLSLTCNKEVPPSISKLFNLQFLIIHPHLNIKSCGAPLFLPVQIWDMQELKHIEIMGSCLPNPSGVASLEKLSTLVGVSASSCTREVFEKIPNIRKLGIQVEWLPNDDSNPLSCFDHISQLKNLHTLKCNIVNPKFESKFVVPLVTPLPTFSSSLKKLHLSGLGYPWECMSVIGSLPNLEVLKLRCYAFRGPKWEVEVKSFLSLKFLLIEDSDLVKWEPRPGSFPELTYLLLKHCYKLKELDWPKTSFHMGRIELVDCHPLAVTCAKQLKSKTELEIIASFGDGKLK